MTFGEDWGWGASKDESQKIFNTYVEAGGNFIDTACNYTEGTSEKYVGDFVSADRDHFVVATKYTLKGNTENQNDPNSGGNARKNMMRTVEQSLKRLKSDYIDLFYLHMWDGTTPIDEVMRGLDDLVRSGKVQYIGISDTPAWVISQSNILAELQGWSRFVAAQVPYSFASRDVEREIMPMAKALDIAVVPWGIMGGGVLTGKYNDANPGPKRYEETSERGLSLGDLVQEIAREIDQSPAQVAISWVRQQQAKSSIVPILGARTEAQIKDNLKCLDFELSPDHLEKMDNASEFTPGFPTSFLTGEHVRKLIFGETFELIDNHREYL
jgi:aryl-alcohol dehydrogenase-like predicted oxidoreductase